MRTPVLIRCRRPTAAALAALFVALPPLAAAEGRSVSFQFDPPIAIGLPQVGEWSNVENWKPTICLQYSGDSCVEKGYPGLAQPADAIDHVFYHVNLSGSAPFSTTTMSMNVNAGDISGITSGVIFDIDGQLGLQKYKVPVYSLPFEWETATFENNSQANLNGRLYSSGKIDLTGDGILSLTGGLIEVDNFTNSSRINGVGTIKPIFSDVTDFYGNTGIIDANFNGAPLKIYLPWTALSKTYNSGRLEASDGGILRLIGNNGFGYGTTRSIVQSVTFQSSGGVIQALDGSTVELSGQIELRDGRLATAGSGRIEVKGPLWLDSVTNDGLIHVAHGVKVWLVDGISNNGLLQLDGALNDSQIELSGSSTDIVEIGGSGALELNHATRSQLLSWGPGLGNGPQHTIRGTGKMALWESLFNLGLIDADVAGTLKLAWNHTGQMNNSGVLRARNGGLLDIAGAAWTNPLMLNNTGGVLTALDGSVVQLSNTILTGGTLATSGSGVIRLPVSASALGKFENLGTLDIRASTTLSSGTITNHGTILLGNGSAGASLSMTPGVVLGGNGMLTLSNSLSNEIASASIGTGSLTNAHGHTIQGAGRIGTYGLVVVNQGLILANQSNRLELVDPGYVAAKLTNEGTLRAASGSTLQVNGNLTNFDAATHTLSGGRYEVQGTMRLPATGGIATNAADIVLDGPASRLYAGVTGTTDALASFATNYGGGRFEIRNGRNFTAADFLNAGHVAIGGGSLFMADNYAQIAGVTEVDGTLWVLGNLAIAGGQMKGSGSVLGNVVNAGVISPGNSPGVLSVAGDFTQTTGVLAMELGALAADRLVVEGTATLGGTLEVSLWTAPNASPFVPGPGQQFDLVLAAVIAGHFDQVLLPQIAGIAWSLDHLIDVNGATDVLRLSTKPVPLPPALLLAVSALATTVAMTRRRRPRNRC